MKVEIPSYTIESAMAGISSRKEKALLALSHSCGKNFEDFPEFLEMEGHPYSYEIKEYSDKSWPWKKRWLNHIRWKIFVWRYSGKR